MGQNNKRSRRYEKTTLKGISKIARTYNANVWWTDVRAGLGPIDAIFKKSS